MTDFVGRREEIAQLKRLLSTARLVTLTGAGGTGKTRLALRVAADVRRVYADGVCLVDLAPLREEELIEYSVAEALAVHDQTGRDLADTVLDILRDRELLLVLDNCEHVLDGAARFIDLALRAAPGLRILCTSRQPLGTISEHVWRVAPLPVPEPGLPMTPATLLTYPSIVLFAERAAAAAPGFALTADNHDHVAEICRRLDGLPLAIELAAAQLRTLTVDQLETRLSDRLPTLHTRHATPAHHRTLEATFDWSYERASPAEQALWSRLSVFADGLDLDAAEFVCADGGPLLDVISGLVDKSILIREESSDRMRYRLLETVRQYGLRRLRGRGGDRSADELSLRCRHRDWYLRLAERLEADWFGPREEQWSARMRRERSNLRTALGFCLGAGGDPGGALRIASSLQFYWLCCGAQHEGRYWLDRVLAANPAPTVGRARAHAVRSRVLQTLSEPYAAAASARECLAIAHRVGEPSLIARGIVDLAVGKLLAGLDLPGAQALLEQARELLDDSDPPTWSAATTSLGMVMLYQGDPDRAAALCAQARAFSRERGDEWWLAAALSGSAVVELVRDNVHAAEPYLREGLWLVYTLGDASTAARTMNLLGVAAAAAGDHERAARLAGAADGVRHVVGEIGVGSVPWRDRHDRAFTRTREALGETGFAMAHAEGQALSFDDAVSYALGPVGPDPTAPVSPAPPADPLSRREYEVAVLVAEGLTNKQIATKLVVAQRTAESHVENILRKLAFNCRAQIAAWYAERMRTDGL